MTPDVVSPTLPVSVLDLASRSAGETNADALAGSITLAQHAESLGFRRFWVAEHHGMATITSSAPAVLIAAIAAATKHIRVGSGGVMLPNHAPLVIAEQFGTLRALFGDRIDLGIGRAPGTDAATAMALRRSEHGLGVDDFPQQLMDLFGFFYGGMPDSNPLHTITAVPGRGDDPEIWLLGSSGYSAQVAAALGLPFVFAHHFAGENTEAALSLYRSRFQPNEVMAQPRAMISVNVVAHEDPQMVRALSLPAQLAFLRLRTGAKVQPVSIDEALQHQYTPLEEEFIATRMARQAIGTPQEVAVRLRSLLDATKPDELILSPSAATLAGRIGTLDIVANILGLRVSDE